MKKKILVYCQHVLGVGHFFRTLEIIRALDRFDVILVTGGRPVDGRLPDHVRHVELPALMMDASFSSLHSPDGGTTGEIKLRRRQLLLDVVQKEVPDLVLIELFPFGRKAFGFEIEPMIDLVRLNRKRCFVVCSLRDILVEKNDVQAYERRVVKQLNQRFDAVLIHSDSRIVSLDATFSDIKGIRLPLLYTGFVTPFPDPGSARVLRREFAPDMGQSLIVVSAGSGSVGAELLKACARASSCFTFPDRIRMVIITGPYMGDDDVCEIRALARPGMTVRTFVRDFVSLLSAADLSVSMAGYNTLMNTVAANVPALVWPFGQNREQALRVERLAGLADIRLLDNWQLEAATLCSLMETCLDRKAEKTDGNERVVSAVDLHGATNTARLITQMLD